MAGKLHAVSALVITQARCSGSLLQLTLRALPRVELGFVGYRSGTQLAQALRRGADISVLFGNMVTH